VRSGKLIANIAELELPTGTASGRITADMTELVPRYALRGKIENFDPATTAQLLTGLPLLSGRTLVKVELKAAGQTPAEALRSLSGKVGISMPESGRLALDLRAIRGVAEPNFTPSQLIKSTTSIDGLEARANLLDGVLVGEHVQARTGSLNISASGSADLLDRTLDLRLQVQPAAAADKPPPADAAAAAVVSVSGPWADPAVRREQAGAPDVR
jgi:AsmA-like C-terminal region